MPSYVLAFFLGLMLNWFFMAVMKSIEVHGLPF